MSGKKIIAIVIIIAACIAAAFTAVHFINQGSPKNTDTKIAVHAAGNTDEGSGADAGYEGPDISAVPENPGTAAEPEISDTDTESETSDVNTVSVDFETAVREVRERFENIPEDEIEPFTDEEIAVFEEAGSEIDVLTDGFYDEDGYINPEDREKYLDTIEEYISGLVGSGGVAAYERDDTSISILFDSGISYYIAAPIKGLLNSGDDETRVLALETFSGADYSIFDPDRNLSGKDLRKIAQKIDESSDKYTFNESNDYCEVENISIDYLKNLNSFKILLWHGHGGHGTVNETFLMSNQGYNKDDTSLSADIKLGRLTIARANGLSPRKYAITSKFVDKYFPKIDDAIVYLGACETCMTSDLAESFIRRGARCVIGYTKEVHVTYEMNCRAQLFERLRNGESIPDAIEHTTNDLVYEPLNWTAGGQLRAFYADGITPSDQYLETENDVYDDNTDPAQAYSIPDAAALSPGQEITFGSYYRDYEYPNDKMPIEWVVLDANGKEALITSKYALINLQYLDYIGNCTWETSYLRQWLNNNFYNEAFSDEEKQVIALTELANNDNTQFGTDGGNNTTDRIFVLSAEEAEKYYSSNAQRQACGTSWAYNNGLAIIDPETGDYSNVVFNGIYGYLEGFNCMYWLRTPGADSGAAAYVDEKGAVQLGGNWVYYYPDADPKVASPLPEIGVRPVLRLVSGSDDANSDDLAMIKAYRKVLDSYYSSAADTPQYGFGFIDDDDIPELLISEGRYHAAGVQIYSFKNGEAEKMGVFGSDGNMSYLPYEDVIFTYWIGQGHYINTYYHLNGTVIHSSHHTDEGTPEGASWQIDDRDVSEAEYDSFSEQIRIEYSWEEMITVGIDESMYGFSDDAGFDWLESYLEGNA